MNDSRDTSFAVTIGQQTLGGAVPWAIRPKGMLQGIAICEFKSWAQEPLVAILGAV